MKIIFLGNSDLSVLVLKRLVEEGHEILAAVCQPDKPNARGNKIEISEVKKFALSKNIPVYQFKKIRLEGVEPLKALNPELLIVVYYGQILSQEILDLGNKGIINLHPSLLPKYRGPSPVITSILNGDKETGVTIMRVAKGIDAGNIILQEKTPIFDGETAGELWKRLTKIGCDLLIESIKLIQKGNFIEIEQRDSMATFTKKIEKEDAKLDFNKNAEEVINQVRAFNPTPVAYFQYKDEIFKVYQAEIDNLIAPQKNGQFEKGMIIKASVKEGLVIKCNNGFVSIKKIQAPNGKILNIKDFLNGKKFEVGYVIKQNK